MKTLTQEELKQKLHYDPKTGIFTWLIAPKRGGFAGKKINVGSQAGAPSGKDKNHRIGIDGKVYFAQHLAWLYMEGYWAEHPIIFKDSDKLNLIWSNLQVKSLSCIMQSRQFKKKNKSGYTGIKRSTSNKWVSVIKVNNKQYTLGAYSTILNALLARFTFQQQCPSACDYRNKTLNEIKLIWPEFKRNE